VRALLIVLTVLAVIPAAAFGLKYQYVLIKANKDLNDSAVMVPVPCDGGEIACAAIDITRTTL